jgi:hypothetical protein
MVTPPQPQRNPKPAQRPTGVRLAGCPRRAGSHSGQALAAPPHGVSSEPHRGRLPVAVFARRQALGRRRYSRIVNYSRTLIALVAACLPTISLTRTLVLW